MSTQPNETNDYSIAEMKEFACFPARTHRYIRCSLDIAFDRGEIFAHWCRDKDEECLIKEQQRVYADLKKVQLLVPNEFKFNDIDSFMGPLIKISAFDLGQNCLDNFGAYRFLYERLLGASARPWLPGAFCAAATLPHLPPKRRKELLQSMSEAAATAPGWSTREPVFFPQWVEKVEQLT